MPFRPHSSATRVLREQAENVAMLARLTRDFPRYLRKPVAVESARQRTFRRMAQRDRRFLRLVELAIYRRPRSPYRRLLEHAGCEPGDLHALVAQEGLEGALRVLATRGVSVTFDEFKGRRPVVRGSLRFDVEARDFDNPVVPPHFLLLTSGSAGTPSRVRQPLHNTADGASAVALALDAHGIKNPRNLFWFAPLMTWPFLHLKLGHTIDAWYSPLERLPPHVNAALHYLSALARVGGRHLPVPRYLDPQDPQPVVEWLIRNISPDRPIVVNTRTSTAVRIALAAQAQGHSLDGVVFHGRGEPLSAARREHLEQSGAHVLASYSSAELPFIAYLCPESRIADDLHVCLDRYAVIGHQRPAFTGGPVVASLLTTTIAIGAGKLALNTELGDAGDVTARDCTCRFGSYGYRTRIANIRSFEKLSSEGTTFAREDVLTILETTLPARFGGSAVDYQVVEEEAPNGASLLILRVHPGVGPVDPAAIRTTLLEELARGGEMDAYRVRLIERARSIVVRRLPPVMTGAGKVLPFQLAKGARSIRTTPASSGGC